MLRMIFSRASLKNLKKIGEAKDAKTIADYEYNLRHRLIDALDRVLYHRPLERLRTSFQSGHSQKRLVLLRLYEALKEIEDQNSDHAKLEYRFEEARPLQKGLTDKAFHEALFSLRINGQSIATPKVLEALTHIPEEQKLPKRFKLWMKCAQIKSFYQEKENANKRLSFNVSSHDLDSPEYAKLIEKLIDLTQKERYPSPVLEALETDPWTKERIAKFNQIINAGARIALDDYGAKDGFMNIDVLRDFLKSGHKDENLMIKIDGKIIRGALRDKAPDDDQDPACELISLIAEIKKEAPKSMIVAEWINSAEEAEKLTAILNNAGLDQGIHFVQSRDIHVDAKTFFREFRAACREKAADHKTEPKGPWNVIRSWVKPV